MYGGLSMRMYALAIVAAAAPRLASAPNMSGKDLRLAPHPIEKIGPDQHAEAATGIGEWRRIPPGIIGLR
jgi:hypothetical protein